MAIRDYLEDKVEVTEDFKGIPFKRPQTASVSLASVDSDMEQAQKAAQNRGRREAIQKQIDNLENHNKELRASLENLRKNTLSNMDEDKIVAMAKAKGIKNEDIDAWLKGRAQRSAREISGAQTRELEKQAEELNIQNKEQLAQAIFDADKEYASALETARSKSQDETVVSMDKDVLSSKNRLNTLKSQFKRRYGVTWEEYTETEEEGKEEGAGAKVTPEKPQFVKETLTEEEEAVLDEPTLQKFNERDTTNKEKRAIKAKAQEKIRKKGEADKARQAKLNEIKGHLKTLGITKDTKNVTQAFNEARKTTDKIVRNAYDEVIKFMREDKVYNSYPKSKDLL